MLDKSRERSIKSGENSGGGGNPEGGGVWRGGGGGRGGDKPLTPRQIKH